MGMRELGVGGEGRGGKERGSGEEGGGNSCHMHVCPLKYHSSPRLGILHLQIPDFSVVEKTGWEGARIPRPPLGSSVLKFIGDFTAHRLSPRSSPPHPSPSLSFPLCFSV